MTPFEQWCEAMCERFQGRIALSNILYDHIHGRVDDSLIQRFLHDVLADWGTASEGTLAYLGIDKVLESGGSGYCHKGTRRINIAIGCSRIVVAADFVRLNVNSVRRGWSIKDFVPPGRIAELESGLAGIAQNTMPPIDPSRPLKRPLSWVTKTDTIDAIRGATGKNEFPSTLRNLLGVEQCRGEVQLLELRYPVELPQLYTFVAPTFLDGGSWLVFRSKDGPDGWGVTVNLTDGGDGVPEAVHAQVPFTEKFQVKDVGWTRQMREDFDFEKLVGRMPAPWGGGSANLFSGWI